MVRGSSPTTVTSYEPRSPRALAAHDQRMLLPSAAVGPVQRKCTSVAKYFRLPITSITLRPGILAGLSARALAEALPSALPKASSIPAAGDEEGEGLGVLGSGDSEGGAVIVGSLDVCPTASRSGNTPMSQAAAATRKRSADTATRILNPTRIPTMDPPLADTDTAIVPVPAGAPRARSQYAKDRLTSVGEAC